MNTLNNKKIIIVSNTAWSLFNYRLGLARKLKESGARVVFVAPHDAYAVKLLEEFEFIPLRFLGRKGRNPFGDMQLLFECIKIYKKIKPDAVVNFTIKPNIYSSFACGILHISSMSVLTGLGSMFVRKGLLQNMIMFLYLLSMRCNKKVIFQNNDDLNFFVNKHIVPRAKCELIHGSGVNADFFDSRVCQSIIKTPYTKFLMISRLIADKGVQEYYMAAKIVKTLYPETEFILIGDFDDNPSAISENEVTQWVDEGFIRYLGYFEDVRPFLCESDAVVLPSYREGLPRSLIEAMAMSKPIITTNVSGCRDLVSESTKNGFLVPEKDEKSLAQAMIYFIKTPESKRIEMGKNGRNIILSEFDERIIVREYITMIEGLVL